MSGFDDDDDDDDDDMGIDGILEGELEVNEGGDNSDWANVLDTVAKGGKEGKGGNLAQANERVAGSNNAWKGLDAGWIDDLNVIVDADDSESDLDPGSLQEKKLINRPFSVATYDINKIESKPKKKLTRLL